MAFTHQPAPVSENKAPTQDTKETETQQLSSLSQFSNPLQNLVLEYEYTENSIDADKKNDDSNFKSDNYYSSTQVGPTLFESRLPVITLLRHVVRGEYKEVDAMLTKNPLLLFEADNVTDYACGYVSHRKHQNRTAYQLALGAVDRDLFYKNGNKMMDGIIELIEKHFNSPRLLNLLEAKSPEEIKKIKEKYFPAETKDEDTQDLNVLVEKIRQKQHEGQYPKGHEEKEQERVKNDSKELNAVINVVKQASQEECKQTSTLEDALHTIRRTEKSERADTLRRITTALMKANSDIEFEEAFAGLTNYVIKQGFLKSDAFDFRVLKAIYRFRNYLEPRGAMTSGKHFNHELLGETATHYDNNYDEFGAGYTYEYESPKNELCWQKIFGYVERFVPSSDGQVIARGPWSILGNGKQSSRSLNFRGGGGRYFPLDLDPIWEVGHNYARHMGYGGRCGDCGAVTFQILCRAKTEAPVMHRRDNLPQKSTRCAIL